mmetsp:Transcript_3494/g.4720  ORF Transcript_3494/g.4720 Transcript_3494/m.4720 type:complete len:189 (+) Transcript_3494:765-1331(+)
MSGSGRKWGGGDNGQPRHHSSGMGLAGACKPQPPQGNRHTSQASGDGRVILHSLRKATHLCTLTPTLPPHPATGAVLLVSDQAACIVLFSPGDLTLRSYSLGGAELARVESCERVMAAACTQDGRFLVTGGEQGVLLVRHVHDLSLHRRYQQLHAPITALVVSVEHCVIVGLQDGSLLLWAPTSLSLL